MGSSPPRPTTAGSKPACAGARGFAPVEFPASAGTRGFSNDDQVGLGRVKGHVDVDVQGGIG